MLGELHRLLAHVHALLLLLLAHGGTVPHPRRVSRDRRCPHPDLLFHLCLRHMQEADVALAQEVPILAQGLQEMEEQIFHPDSTMRPLRLPHLDRMILGLEHCEALREVRPE